MQMRLAGIVLSAAATVAFAAACGGGAAPVPVTGADTAVVSTVAATVTDTGSGGTDDAYDTAAFPCGRPSGAPPTGTRPEGSGTRPEGRPSPRMTRPDGAPPEG